MKDLFELMLYPHNIVLLALLVACVAYRKKGLWLIFAFYYLSGNTFIANQLRQLYVQQLETASPAVGSQMVVLGCGGSATSLPACAKARLSDALARLPEPAALVLTSEYCQPYVDYVLSHHKNLVVECFNGGENTYQEFNTLKQRGINPDYILSSDYHSWRVEQLARYHGFTAKVLASSTYTFRPVNCGAECFISINLSNFDFYSKMIAEFSSYAVFVLTRQWVDWYQPANG